jgi:hypothetical protein
VVGDGGHNVAMRSCGPLDAVACAASGLVEASSYVILYTILIRVSSPKVCHGKNTRRKALQRKVSPLRGFWFLFFVFPGAYAPGYFMSALRAWEHRSARGAYKAAAELSFSSSSRLAESRSSINSADGCWDSAISVADLSYQVCACSCSPKCAWLMATYSQS